MRRKKMQVEQIKPKFSLYGFLMRVNLLKNKTVLAYKTFQNLIIVIFSNKKQSLTLRR